MRGLVRHHPLLRSLPKPLIVAVSTASVGMNILLFDRLESAEIIVILSAFGIVDSVVEKQVHMVGVEPLE